MPISTEAFCSNKCSNNCAVNERTHFDSYFPCLQEFLKVHHYGAFRLTRRDKKLQNAFFPNVDIPTLIIRAV